MKVDIKVGEGRACKLDDLKVGQLAKFEEVDGFAFRHGPGSEDFLFISTTENHVGVLMKAAWKNIGVTPLPVGTRITLTTTV